jgi:hypothetical protein
MLLLLLRLSLPCVFEKLFFWKLAFALALLASLVVLWKVCPVMFCFLTCCLALLRNQLVGYLSYSSNSIDVDEVVVALVNPMFCTKYINHFDMIIRPYMLSSSTPIADPDN